MDEKEDDTERTARSIAIDYGYDCIVLLPIDLTHDMTFQ